MGKRNSQGAAPQAATGNVQVALRELEPSAGTVTENELADLFESFEVKVSDEIQFPFTEKLSKRHALFVERRASQRVTSTGLVNLYNWRVTENMANDVRKE